MAPSSSSHLIHTVSKDFKSDFFLTLKHIGFTPNFQEYLLPHYRHCRTTFWKLSRNFLKKKCNILKEYTWIYSAIGSSSNQQQVSAVKQSSQKDIQSQTVSPRRTRIISRSEFQQYFTPI